MSNDETPLNPREKSAKARALWMKGYQAQMDGQAEQAIHYYQDSIKLFPTAEAYTFLGWAYSFQGRVQQAIDECLKAIETDPSFGNPYNDIGAYLIELGKWEEAIPWLEKAAQAERYEPRHYPHFNLARVYMRLGKPDQALEQLNKALELYPGYQAALQAIAQINSRYN